MIIKPTFDVTFQDTDVQFVTGVWSFLKGGCCSQNHGTKSLQDVSRATRKGKAINGNLLKIKQCKSFTRFVFSHSAVVKNQYSPFALPQPLSAKFCITFVFHFSWVLQPSHEKLKTMLMLMLMGDKQCAFWEMCKRRMVLNAEEIAGRNHNESFTRNHVSESYTRSQDSDTLARSSEIHKYSKPIFI